MSQCLLHRKMVLRQRVKCPPDMHVSQFEAHTQESRSLSAMDGITQRAVNVGHYTIKSERYRDSGHLSKQGRLGFGQRQLPVVFIDQNDLYDCPSEQAAKQHDRRGIAVDEQVRHRPELDGG